MSFTTTCILLRRPHTLQRPPSTIPTRSRPRLKRPHAARSSRWLPSRLAKRRIRSCTDSARATAPGRKSRPAYKSRLTSRRARLATLGHMASTALHRRRLMAYIRPCLAKATPRWLRLTARTRKILLSGGNRRTTLLRAIRPSFRESFPTRLCRSGCRSTIQMDTMRSRTLTAHCNGWTLRPPPRKST